jgi:hypothetical protein
MPAGVSKEAHNWPVELQPVLLSPEAAVSADVMAIYAYAMNAINTIDSM